MQETLLKRRYLEKGLSRNLIKFNLIFLSNTVRFNGQDYVKHKAAGTSDQLLFRLPK